MTVQDLDDWSKYQESDLIYKQGFHKCADAKINTGITKRSSVCRLLFD